MSYFQDLSDYSYGGGKYYRPGTKNVGWLSADHEFNKGAPAEDVLDLLWDFCKISLVQTRGMHRCELCSHVDSHINERHGQRLSLGSAEIRVFSVDGLIYASPNLIYHYVSRHHYKPPAGFIRALKQGARPASSDYQARLSALGLDWHETWSPP